MPLNGCSRSGGRGVLRCVVTLNRRPLLLEQDSTMNPAPRTLGDSGSHLPRPTTARCWTSTVSSTSAVTPSPMPRTCCDRHERGLTLAFVTNNAARTPHAIADHLRGLGVDAADSDVVTSAQAAARELCSLASPGPRSWWWAARASRRRCATRVEPGRLRPRPARRRRPGFPPHRRLEAARRGRLCPAARSAVGRVQPRPHGAHRPWHRTRQRRPRRCARGGDREASRRRCRQAVGLSSTRRCGARRHSGPWWSATGSTPTSREPSPAERTPCW